MVASDTPKTHVAACKGSCLQSRTHGYGSANRNLLTCYLPLRSYARTRRRAACKTAVSALSRRSCSRYSRTASGCAAFHRSGNNSSVLAVPRSMCVMTLSKYIAKRGVRIAEMDSTAETGTRIEIPEGSSISMESLVESDVCTRRKAVA